MAIEYEKENIRLVILICVAMAIIVSLFAVIFMLQMVGIQASSPPYCQYGDIDGDGVIDKDEYLLTPRTWYEKERGDVDNDGDFDSYDTTLIAYYINGVITQFPVGDRSSDSYQYDTPPYVKTVNPSSTSLFVGQTLYLYVTGNDSNGETLKIWVQVRQAGNVIYEFPAVISEPGVDNKFTYTFDYAGTYDIVVYVGYAYRGMSAPDSQTIRITVEAGNTPPVPSFSWSPPDPVVGEEVTFDASGSYDPDGWITSYSWYIDNQVKTGKTITHIFSRAGKYTVTLTVTDNDGLSESFSSVVTVSESATNPPVADFTFIVDGKTVTFTDRSYDSDGYITSWLWDFGDGETSTEQNPVHEYLFLGTYTVTLTITDNDGLSGVKSKVVDISSPVGYPVADFTFAIEGKTVYFYDNSYDTDGTIVSWLWNFGDGKISTERSPIHEYSSAGRYTVTLTVTDNDGLSASAVKTVVVEKDYTLYYIAGGGIALMAIVGAVIWRRKRK